MAFRNLRIRPWDGNEVTNVARRLNEPPSGFTALFNGKDCTGWRLAPLGRQAWVIENGELKSQGTFEQWGADLATEKAYRDFVLLVDFRFPTLSASGINFRRLLPKMENFGQSEQLNLRSRGGLGHLKSFYFMPNRGASFLKIMEYVARGFDSQLQ